MDKQQGQQERASSGGASATHSTCVRSVARDIRRSTSARTVAQGGHQGKQKTRPGTNARKRDQTETKTPVQDHDRLESLTEDIAQPFEATVRREHGKYRLGWRH